MLCLKQFANDVGREINKNNGKDGDLEQVLIDCTTLVANVMNAKEPFDTGMDIALIRWSVVHKTRSENGLGDIPYLPAFLAGWTCRAIGASQPLNIGQFRDSFRAGWLEADQHIEIESREPVCS